MSTEPEQYGLNNTTLAQEKTNFPGIFLILVGVFNLLLSMLPVFIAAQTYLKTEAQLEAEMEDARQKLPPQWKGWLPPPGQAADTKSAATIIYSVWGTLSILSALLILNAGMRLRSLHSYGLAIIGSLVACVPVISCCCGLGQIAGIWAMIILMDTDVRAAFR